MRKYKASARRCTLALIAALAGGSLAGTCQLRLRNAVIDASRQTVSSILDPGTIAELLGFPAAP